MSLVSADDLRPALQRLQALRTDEQAWNVLYRRLWPLVFATNYRFVRGDKHLAEDASQEVFVRLLRYTRFEDFADRPEVFPSYVQQICRNVSRSYLSILLRHPVLLEGDSEETREQVENASAEEGTCNPELQVLQSAEVASLLSALSADDRQLFQLLVEGHTTSEISNLLNISYSNAGVRIHRLRNLLKKKNILTKIL